MQLSFTHTLTQDMAVLTDNVTLCERIYARESFNVQPRQHCRERYDNTNQPKGYSMYNNEGDCVENGGVCERERECVNVYVCVINPSLSHSFTGEWFTEYAWIDIDSNANSQQACINRNLTDQLRRVWAPPSFGDSAACLVLPPPPVCIQGGWSRVNHLGNGRDGVPLNYTWELPFFPSQETKLAVVRIR